MSKTHYFTVSVEYNHSIYDDCGFIIFPESYGENNSPTRLVISCHGAGGTVETNDSQVEHQTLTQYLLANGYAVMDVNGLPFKLAEQYHIDIRNNIGSFVAMEAYEKAYRYCTDKFNLKKEVFVHGASMGGISSTNLVLREKIPVIAQTGFCPVLDTYNEIFLHPWSNGLPKIALGILYNLDKDSFGNYIYDEQKICGLNPVNNKKLSRYPVPLKFWHCVDDETVSYKITKEFTDKIAAYGGCAQLILFEQGGHEPQDAGEIITNPSGNTMYGNQNLIVRSAVEGVMEWIKKYDF